MFGLKRMKSQIKDLESRVYTLYQLRQCDVGKHAWDTRFETYYGYAIAEDKSKPYVVCACCFIRKAMFPLKE